MTNNFRSVRVGWEHKHDPEAAEPNEENTVWGNTFGAVITDGKGPKGADVTCKKMAVKLSSLDMKWRSTNLAKAEKGGVYNLITS